MFLLLIHDQHTNGMLTANYQVPQLVFDALVEEYDVCRYVPRHAVTIRRYHYAGLREQTFRCRPLALDPKILLSQLGDVGVEQLVPPPPRESRQDAPFSIRDLRRLYASNWFVTATREDSNTFCTLPGAASARLPIRAASCWMIRQSILGGRHDTTAHLATGAAITTAVVPSAIGVLPSLLIGVMRNAGRRKAAA